MPINYLQNARDGLMGVVLVLLAGLASGAAAEDLPSLEDVLAKAAESASTISSWSADIEIDAAANGMEMHTKGKVMGSDGRLRSEMSMEVMGDMVQVKNVRGEDGIQWTELDQAGRVQVTKLDMNAIEAHRQEVAAAGGSASTGMSKEQDPSELLQSYKGFYDLEVTGMEALEGTSVYIIEGPLKEELKGRLSLTGVLASSGAKLSRARIAVGADDGFARKLEILVENGNAIRTVSYKNFNADADLDGMLFRYTPPEGVQVSDMTDSIKQMTSKGGVRRGH